MIYGKPNGIYFWMRHLLGMFNVDLLNDYCVAYLSLPQVLKVLCPICRPKK